MDNRENKFNFMKEQIRNFITHCLGFQPEDMTGGEFSNEFTWKTNNSKFKIVAYYGCGWKKESDYFDYYLTIDGQKTNGTYSFGTQLTCEDENAIAKIIQPFKESVVNKTTLDVTTNIEQSPYFKWYYIIQAFKDYHWQDVLFSRGDISTAEKKARHYRNQNNCETRVISVKENVNYSYEYELVTKYDKEERTMTEKHTLTVVINVFDDKYCDVYFFTPEHKKWCANSMCNNKFASFVKDSMYYPLFNTKYDSPEKDLKSLVRTYLNSQFNRVRDMNINSYIDFSQSYSLEPAFDIDDCVMDEVYVCDYRIGKLYNPDLFHNRTPGLYRADEFVCDDDCTFHLLQEDLDDVISTVRRCGDELETFAELSLYAVKDDREIEVCPFSVGNKDYFVRKAREHADVEYYLTHKTYVYEYKNGKTNKIYGCCRFNEASNVVALDLEKEDACNKEDNSKQCCSDKDKIDNIKRFGAFGADNFLFILDNQIRWPCCSEVQILYQKGKTTVKTKFYFNEATRNIRTSNTFNIGSKHSLSLTLFDKDLKEPEELLSLASSTLTEKFFSLNNKGSGSPLEFELTFEAE